MTLEIEKPLSPKTNLNNIDASQNAHLDLSCPRSVWDESTVQPGVPEDQLVFRQWKLGFFIFYGAIVLLLGGLAIIADRPGMFTSAAAPTSPAIASADTVRRPH
jgi:hypothetical protein